MWSALTSTTSFGSRGTGIRSLPDQRLLPPGARPVKPDASHQRFEQPSDLGGVLVDPSAADIVEPAIGIVEPEQQMLDGLRAGLSVEPADDAIDRLPDLELLHRPLARQVGLVEPLRDDAIEPLPAEPTAGDSFLLGGFTQAQSRRRALRHQ